MMSIHITAAAILPGICITLMLSESLVIVLPSLLTLLAPIIVALFGGYQVHTTGQILLGYGVVFLRNWSHTFI